MILLCLLFCYCLPDENGCFSGDSKVIIQEQQEPIAMRDLQTGQHVQCVDHQDMLLPTTLKWCEVMNWVSNFEE